MLPLVAAVLAQSQAAPVPHLVLQDLEGKESILATDNLRLRDPRERGAWVVRPAGFQALDGERRSSGRARLVLVSGDELWGRVRGGTGESVLVELTSGVSLPIEISELVSLDVPDFIPSGQRSSLPPAAEGDRLYRRTGGALDAIDGTLEGFTDEGVRLQSVLGAKTFSWEEVAALRIEVLEDEPVSASAPEVPVHVALVDGSRLRGGLVSLDSDRCHLVLGGRHEVSFPLAAIAELTVADGRLTYLSELEPVSETGRGTPFGDELGMTWPHRMDANVLGGPLRSGGKAYLRGVGMHAPSRLVFRLDGEPRVLRGRVGIDDSARINGPAARGSVVFRVWLDGKRAWESALLRGGDEPALLPALDLAGARELALEVDPAGDFAGDRANWLGVVLVR